jgi:hypothetical protein
MPLDEALRRDGLRGDSPRKDPDERDVSCPLSSASTPPCLSGWFQPLQIDTPRLAAYRSLFRHDILSRIPLEMLLMESDGTLWTPNEFTEMRLKQLESHLQDVSIFESPKISLEQYPTSPHIAARMLYTAEHTYGDVSSMHCIDLGCGTGMLSIAAILLDAGHVLGIDVDSDALGIANRNFREILYGSEDDRGEDDEARTTTARTTAARTAARISSLQSIFCIWTSRT